MKTLRDFLDYAKKSRPLTRQQRTHSLQDDCHQEHEKAQEVRHGFFCAFLCFLWPGLFGSTAEQRQRIVDVEALKGLTKVLVAALAVLVLSGVPADLFVAAQSPEPRQTAKGSRLGVGFLIGRGTDGLVPLLQTDRDFQEMMLGPGKIRYVRALKPPARVMCICQSLEGMAKTVELLREAEIGPDRVYIAYNPEPRPPQARQGTPREELDDFLGSLKKARTLVKDYGAPLIMGPGLGEMAKREHLYPELAKHCDIWMIQTQRLQLDLQTGEPVSPERYREQVKRIVGLLRQGNPDMRGFFASKEAGRRGPGQYDGYDTIEWFATQPWCNGKVGMMGFSHLGAAQYEAAVTGPPHLACAIPAQAPGNYYTDFLFPPKFRKADMETILRGTFSSRTTALWNTRIRRRDNSRIDQFNAPLLHSAGWYDFYKEGAIEMFRALPAHGGPAARGTQKLIIGPSPAATSTAGTSTRTRENRTASIL